MRFQFRRSEPQPTKPIEPTKFARFGTGEVMDVIESSMMTAQQHFDGLRRSAPDQRGFMLHELIVHLEQAALGATELQAREQDL